MIFYFYQMNIISNTNILLHECGVHRMTWDEFIDKGSPHIECFTYYIEKASEGMRDVMMYEMLECGALNNHLNVVKYAVAHEARVSQGNFFVVGMAVEYGLLDILKYLIQFVPDDNPYKFNEYIRVASMFGHVEIVKFMLEHNKHNESGIRLGIRFSAKQGHMEVLKVLAPLSADKDNFKWAADLAKNDEIKQFLNAYI
jgi:hypothetical protein